MDQDVLLGITGSVTQADLAPLRLAGRLGEHVLVYRVVRQHQGGGYGDQDKHPMAWAVAVYLDSQLMRVYNARGAGREWNSNDRLSAWLRDQGFWCWWTRNDLEVVGSAAVDSDAVDSDAIDSDAIDSDAIDSDNIDSDDIGALPELDVSLRLLPGNLA